MKYAAYILLVCHPVTINGNRVNCSRPAARVAGPAGPSHERHPRDPPLAWPDQPDRAMSGMPAVGCALPPYAMDATGVEMRSTTLPQRDAAHGHP